MKDRHARQIAGAISSTGSLIAFAIWVGFMFNCCMLSPNY